MGGGGFRLDMAGVERSDTDTGRSVPDVEAPAEGEGAYDQLMSPAPRGEHVDECLERANARYVCKDGHFLRDGRGYDCQYAQIYFQRLTTLKKSLRSKVEKKWPDFPVVNILELNDGEPCCVIGTIFKDMKLKPSIMNEYLSNPTAAPAMSGAKLIDPTDTVVMEDEGARMTMSANPQLGDALQHVVTGVIAAVRGKDNDGVFEVEEILFPGMAPQPPLPTRDDDAYVALISGVGLGQSGAAGEGALRFQLAIDYLIGLLGSPQDQETASRVVRVVVAGGLLGGEEPNVGARAAASAKAIAVETVREADLALTQLASGVPVDVMPGASDPATASLPQQPMHRCLFPGAAAFPTVTRATNPHAFEVGGVSFLGCSGQTMDDIFRFTPCEDRLEIMSSTLKWRHLSPTSPDTLPTFPFSDRDPFILHDTPHCYFVGNQPQFLTRSASGPDGQVVRLVCVPRFADSGTVVLVNLRNLTCRPVHFEIPMLQE